MFENKYTHTNLITNDWKKLSNFYIKVFHCAPRGPVRRLSGKNLADGTGTTSPEIEGVHLQLPGYGSTGPTLEIFQYRVALPTPERQSNSLGYTHIAFEVSDIEETCRNVIRFGGWMLGKLVRQPVEGIGICTFVYIRDPDRNIIEIQKWEST